MKLKKPRVKHICRCSQEHVKDLKKEVMSHFRYFVLSDGGTKKIAIEPISIYYALRVAGVPQLAEAFLASVSVAVENSNK